MSKSISPKVVASTIGSAAVVIACWLISLAGVDVPIEVAAALTVIATFLCGYLKLDPARS